MAIREPSLSQSDAPVTDSSTSCGRTTQQKILTVRCPARTLRQLTPQKLGVAWEKVRRVVRDFCRQRGPECPLCRPYGGRIEFQLTAGHLPINLDLDGNRIVARIGSRRWTIRIVRIKSGGSGYQLRRKILSATRLLIELLKEAQRQKEELPIVVRCSCLGQSPSE